MPGNDQKDHKGQIMDKEIRYTGQTAAPSDYDCADGYLALSMNLWPENGALKPVLQPKFILNTGNPARVVRCVHSTASYKHYIATYTDDDGLELSYFYFDENGTAQRSLIDSGLRYAVTDITAVGNTIVLLTDEGLQYYLWQNSSYKYIGDHLPELHLAFGLKGRMEASDKFQVTFPEPISGLNLFSAELSDKNSDTLTSRVLAEVNKFIAEKGTDNGKFIMPFFVRYAYRLYDGSVTMHSAPVLMITSAGITPQVNCLYSKKAVTQAGTVISIDSVRVSAPVYDLMFKAVESGELNEIMEHWGDIIDSIDIFISKPIYWYDQNGKCKKLSKNAFVGETFGYDECEEQKTGKSSYRCRSVKEMYLTAYDYSYNSEVDAEASVRLPEKEDYDKEVEDCSSYYLLKSYKPSKLSTEIQLVEVAKDYLQSLVNRESLPDDYDSHDTIAANCAFGYNARLNLANISKKLFDGFTSMTMFNLFTGTENSAVIDFFVKIKQDGKDVIVHSADRNNLSSVAFNSPLLWFYYPNPNAYKVILRVKTFRRVENTIVTTVNQYGYDLTKHGFLNGAYYFSGGLNYYDGRSITHWYSATPLPESEHVTESQVTDRMINLPNKIYTSEVNNPFYFPLTGINTVGVGEILGVSTSTKALSQGQFGQFPLYAFATDGIWALEVSETGGYKSKQPVSRDVCSNAESITQTDDAVLFTSERGIMLISGSEVICLSDIIDERNDAVFGIFSYTGCRVLVGDDDRDIYRTLRFRDFISDCRFLYDYTSRRIIAFNPSCRYAYIYSLNDKAWAMMPSKISRAVLSYPETLAMTSEGDLLDYSKRIPNKKTSNLSSIVNQVVVTRPFKMDMPDVMKTIDTIIQRGNFKRGHVQQILYGSRDLINWTPIYSSVDHYLRGFRGTPYKYFRIALKCSLTDDESLSGMSVQFTPRYTNQPR